MSLSEIEEAEFIKLVKELPPGKESATWKMGMSNLHELRHISWSYQRDSFITNDSENPEKVGS